MYLYIGKFFNWLTLRTSNVSFVMGSFFGDARCLEAEVGCM